MGRKDPLDAPVAEVAEVAELTRWQSWSAIEWYDFACVYALAGEKLPDRKREYADRAMELLGRAVSDGVTNVEHMTKDTDLDPLRAREDFKKLLASIRPPKPKTPAKARELAPLPRPAPTK